MVIAACSPSIFFSPISEKLISKIESSPLDKSWIPETERLRQINQSKISGIKTSGYETGVDEEGMEFIFYYNTFEVSKISSFWLSFTWKNEILQKATLSFIMVAKLQSKLLLT